MSNTKKIEKPEVVEAPEEPVVEAAPEATPQPVRVLVCNHAGERYWVSPDKLKEYELKGFFHTHDVA